MRGAEKRKAVVIENFKLWAKTAQLAVTAVRDVVEVLLRHLALEPPHPQDQYVAARSCSISSQFRSTAGLEKRSLRR